MKILDRLPLLAADSIVQFGPHRARLHRNSLFVWISIGLFGEDDPRRISPPFPALLDSGNHSEAFIHESHLAEWAGIQPALLPVRRHKKINQERIPFRDADVWIHPNLPGTTDRRADASPFPLRLADGLAVRTQGAEPVVYPRLPLIGFSTFQKNRLDYWFDSKTGSSFLRTAGWRSRIVRSLYRLF